MTGMKLTSDAALARGPELLRIYGSWSNMLTYGEVGADGVIVVKARPAPRAKAKRTA